MEPGALVVPDTSSGPAAAEWIRARWQAFLDLEGKIRALMHEAAVAGAESDDPATKATARDTIERLRGLWDMHAATVARAEALAGLIPNGLGAVLVPAAVIAVAFAVAWIWTRYNAEYRVVRALEAGKVTGEEARRILAEIEGGGPSFSAGLGSAGLLVAVGVLGALWFSQRRPQGA